MPHITNFQCEEWVSFFLLQILFVYAFTLERLILKYGAAFGLFLYFVFASP